MPTGNVAALAAINLSEATWASAHEPGDLSWRDNHVITVTAARRTPDLPRHRRPLTPMAMVFWCEAMGDFVQNSLTYRIHGVQFGQWA